MGQNRGRGGAIAMGQIITKIRVPSQLVNIAVHSAVSNYGPTIVAYCSISLPCRELR